MKRVTEKKWTSSRERLFVLLIRFFLPKCKFLDCPYYFWDTLNIRAEHSNFI